jgi:tRNA U34 5-methylaminomethyl-2-thiouridine-forming methyltransferase MnmC
MHYELRETADGSFTLYLPDMKEQYHSLNGAVTESKYVFLYRGYSSHPSKNPVVLEVGFGTGLNCLVTALEAENLKRTTFYIAIEKYPVIPDLIRKLDYGKYFSKKGEELFQKMHQCDWEKDHQISTYFRLLKMNADITEETLILPQFVDIIYFDAFGPDKQPEMWTERIFSRLYRYTSEGGIIVTYSAKGEVRRRMLSAGYHMEKFPGPPGKKEMLQGIK